MTSTVLNSVTILSFDIGIRNLAWCSMTSDNRILGWDNYDLLAGNSSGKANTKSILCPVCGGKTSYETEKSQYCARHCPPDRPACRDSSGNLLKKLPIVKELKALLESKGLKNLPKSRLDLIAKAREHYALPIPKIKEKKAINTEMQSLHDSIRKFVQKNYDIFRKSTEILLENQPVLKNPTMKTVQVLLYATLRDILQPDPPVLRLVHAKKKVVVETKGDEGYKERKVGGEDRVAKILKEGKIVDSLRWQTHLASYKKKDDLTDAFCMCQDALLAA